MPSFARRKGGGASEAVGLNRLHATIKFIMQRAFQRKTLLLIDRHAVVAQAMLWEFRDLKRKSFGFFSPLAGGDHAIGEAHLVSLISIYRATSEDQVHGPPNAYDPGYD